jgi:RNA polymerase sigma-70 factor (ECF subfamily)
MVQRYLGRFVSDPAEADDVLQEVLLMAWRLKEGPADMQRFGPWCRSLVRRVLSERSRRAGRQQPLLSECDPEDEELASERLDSEALATLREQLQRLLMDTHPRMQRLLIQRYLLEETASEIARQSGTSPAAIRMRLQRLRDRLSTTDSEAPRSSPRARRRPAQAG